MTRRARIQPAARCGWPGGCSVKSVDHVPEPGIRRIWGYHDVQCQVPNPGPGAHLDGYPECGLADGHAGEHDYRRRAAETTASPSGSPRPGGPVPGRQHEAPRAEPETEAEP